VTLDQINVIDPESLQRILNLIPDRLRPQISSDTPRLPVWIFRIEEVRPNFRVPTQPDLRQHLDTIADALDATAYNLFRSTEAIDWRRINAGHARIYSGMNGAN